MGVEYKEYRTKKILNTHKHVDGPWFWGKYTAHPYVGCRYGCSFCYCRGFRYLGRRSPESFSKVIEVKINAVERLQGELFGLPKEIISVGDWQQPVESKYQLSREMLKIVLDYQFPLFIIERSPLLLRDIDLLEEINQASWVGVLFSVSCLNPKVKKAFEPYSPGVKRRLKAMERLAGVGITTGLSMMPILPYICDQEVDLESLIIAAKDHGASCVLAGGLTMDGVQADYTLSVVREYDPSLEYKYRSLYQWKPDERPQYSPPKRYIANLGLCVRSICEKHGLLDRLPRYIVPGPLSINKHVAEKLYLKTYDLELEQMSGYKIWAYRKAAWTVDELNEPIEELYYREGLRGLQSLPNIGLSLSREIGGWLDDKGFHKPSSG